MPETFIERAKRELTKNLSLRIEVLAWFIFAWLFADEFAKEGYLFNFRDLYVPYLTHEMLIGVAFLVAVALRLKNSDT